MHTEQPILIGICGLKGGGKSEVAKRLTAAIGADRIRFAGPLKDMLRAIGLTEDHIEGHLKEAPCDLLCGKTPRHAMLTLGTEWGRDMIGHSLWAQVWQARALKSLGEGRSVIAEDLRFQNENEVLRLLGGIVIRVTRPGLMAGDHVSEQFARTAPADIFIHNNGDLEDLCHYVDNVLPGEIELARKRVA